MKDLGDIVRISQDGATSPPSSFTNQWQRKLNGSLNYVDIPGATGGSYEIQKDDKNAKVRLTQIFTSGAVAISNELQVADFTPPCADPSEYPHIEPSNNVTAGTSLQLWTVLKFDEPEFPESGRLTFWYGTRRDNGTWDLITQTEPSFKALTVTNDMYKLYSQIFVTQMQNGYSNSCNPDRWMSNYALLKAYSTSFNYITVTGPSTINLGDTNDFTFTHHGTVEDFETTMMMLDVTGGSAPLKSLDKRNKKATYSITITSSERNISLIFKFISKDSLTSDSPMEFEHPVTVNTTPPGYYIGNLTIVPQKNEVTLGEQIQIDVFNDGNVPATDVTYNWTNDSSNGITLIASAGRTAWYRFDQVGDNKPVHVLGYNNAAYDTPQETTGYVNVVRGGTPTLGAVTMAGLDNVEQGSTHTYELEWTGTASASDLSIQWAAGGGAIPEPPNVYNPNVTFTSTGTALLLAQVSCTGCDDGSAQMPEKSITVSLAAPQILAPGTPHAGGYVAGIIEGDGSYDGTYNDGTNNRGTQYYIIVAPKTGGESSKKWKNEYSTDGNGMNVRNRVFGKGATEAFADTKHELFNWVINSSSGPRKSNLGGYNDWYVPAWYELEIIYRNLKPGTHTVPSSGTACCGSQGKNPYSVPISDGYTTSHPRQTTVDLFKTGGSEAFSAMHDYKSASQNGSSGDPACQYLGRSFDTGHDRNTTKNSATSRARVIRRVAVP